MKQLQVLTKKNTQQLNNNIREMLLTRVETEYGKWIIERNQVVFELWL